MKSSKIVLLLAVKLSCLIFCHAALAAVATPTIGFDNGTTEGWTAGRPFANPTVQQSGGPAGEGDPFLQVSSTGGNGPGSIVAIFNDSVNWTGDFATPGITGLTLDMMNPTTSNTLEMRLVLFGPNSLQSRWTSSNSIEVPNDGLWRNYVLPIDEASLTRVRGTSTIDAVLADADRLMLRHDAGAPSAGGSASRAVLNVDNIGLVARLFGDYNNNGQIDSNDLDLQAEGILTNDLTYDIDNDGDVDIDDRFTWIRSVQESWVGDSNFDREFNSSDFVAVFSIGKYETGQAATYADGDWNGDLLFDSGDFVVAFGDGGFEQGPFESALVPEPRSWSMLVVVCLGMIYGARHV